MTEEKETIVITIDELKQFITEQIENGATDENGILIKDKMPDYKERIQNEIKEVKQ